MRKLQFTRALKRQNGDFLVEALIGALLIGIVGAGIATTATQVTKTQAVSQRQSLAISRLEGLATGGQIANICGGQAVNLGEGVEYDAQQAACNNNGQINTIGLNLGNAGLGLPNRDINTAQPIVLSAQIIIDPEENPVQLQIGQITQ